MKDIPQVQIHDAKKKLDQKECLFVDIRDPGSYRAAHVPGALHLHDGNVQEFVQKTDKETPWWSTATTVTAVWARPLTSLKTVSRMSRA